MDILGSDADILLGNIPSVSFVYAENFYLKMRELYPDSTIEFTEHSLGGAIA